MRHEVGQCRLGGGDVSRASWSPDGGLLALHALGQGVVIDAASGGRLWHLVDAVVGLDAPAWRARP